MATQQGNNTVGTYKAKTHLCELLEKVEAGEEMTITKHGAPVVKLVPVTKDASPEERVAAIAADSEARLWSILTRIEGQGPHSRGRS